MQFLIDNWMLISVALTSGGLLLWPVVAGGTRAGALSPADAVTWINREKAVVIDVGEPQEFAQGHVVGSRNLPFGQLEDKLPTLVKNKSQPIIVVCPAGARAARAAGLARKLGYAQARALSGGLKAWKDASLPVEKA